MARYELEEVKAAANGNWPAILNRVAGIDDDFLNARSHGPCPKCGGADRWRFTDSAKSGNGGGICNQCGKFGDGFAVVQWYLGVGFLEAVEKVAIFLGIQPTKKAARKGTTKHQERDLSKDLTFLPENALSFAVFAKEKKLSLAAIKRMGGKLARLKNGQVVIAFPVLDGKSQEPIGYTLYDAGGGKLPVWNPKTKSYDQLKVKTIKK